MVVDQVPGLEQYQLASWNLAGVLRAHGAGEVHWRRNHNQVPGDAPGIVGQEADAFITGQQLGGPDYDLLWHPNDHRFGQLETSRVNPGIIVAVSFACEELGDAEMPDLVLAVGGIGAEAEVASVF